MRRLRWLAGRLPAAMLLASAMACPALADDTGAPARVDLGLPARPGAAPGAPTGNPLWSIPLSTLSATRERPIFSPSRRPPPDAQASEPPPEEPEVPSSESAPEGPPDLRLVGTVTGPDQGFALFQEAQSDHVFRLRTGEEHEGWTLQSVQARGVTLSKDGVDATLTLPEREEGATLHDGEPAADSPSEPADAEEPPAPDEAEEPPAPDAPEEPAPADPEANPEDGAPSPEN